MSRSGRFFTRKEELLEPVVNLTPLIDVVFVILIMFIVIAPLLELDRVDLAQASHTDASTSVQENSPIVIYVQKNNEIFFNQKLVTIQELKEKLKEAKVSFPTASPQVFHDQHAYFGTYQSVKNAAESAGFIKMDIILRPGEG